MGCASSLEIVDATFHDLEKKNPRKIQKIPDIWLRFQDDIFMIYNGTKHELDTFLMEINSMHLTYKFTIESSENTVIEI